jgi:putative PIN family toxin of toxin-antitoxin system
MIPVLDASSFISASLKTNNVPGQALLAAIASPNQIITSRDVEDECREVLFRPKFDRFASIRQRDFALQTILSCAHRLTVAESVRDCRDPKDDKYLALAATGNADVIISSDMDLLTMNQGRGIPIVIPRKFLGMNYLEN